MLTMCTNATDSLLLFGNQQKCSLTTRRSRPLELSFGTIACQLVLTG